MLLRQLFDPATSTYTYLLADESTREALLVDPVRETVDRDLEQLRALGLKLVLTVETHVHADHVTGAWALKQQTGCRVAVARVARAQFADVELGDGDVVSAGAVRLRVRATPGHTNGCITFVLEDGSMAFTGDALLIRGCGRTDFQEGSASTLFKSVRGLLESLPPSCVIYPAHDYKGRPFTTVAEERAHNPRLGDGVDLASFEKVMAGLKLAPPKRIAEAVPANLRMGNVPPSVEPPAVPQGFVDGEGI